MTNPLDIIDSVSGIVTPPLEFTHNLARQMESYVIAALSKPLPASDPMSSYRYLNARRNVLQDAARQKPLVRLQDKNLNQLATIGAEISCVTEEIAADSGEATVIIRGGDYLGDFVKNAVRVEEDLHLSVDPQATQPSWKTRWGGKITTINVKRDSSGIHTVELIATSNREHLKTTLIGATPLFPPEIQPIKMWYLPANCRTACAVTLWIQFLRAFDPIASIPTNIFNPFGWINPLGPDAILNLNPLNWPLQVQFVNPILDQSRTTLLAGAWTDFHSSTVDLLKDAGVCARAYTYFTDDKDNPHPELEAVVGPELADFARPNRNAVVVAFEDHSGYSGPTGCVARDTLVQGPDGEERIDVLASGGKSFRVWSVTPEGNRVGATATHAFKKGTAEMFEYTLEDGRSIKATHQHRFLTEQGFVHGINVSVGDEIATVDHGQLQGSIDSPAREVDDCEYKGISESAAVKFRKVVDVESLGVDDFYDMHVPGWENYSANGIWSHNTAADGVINLFSSTLDDLITTTVFPIPDPSSPTGIAPVFQKLFLVAPPPPWATYRDGQESGIIESGYFQHKGPVKTTMTGGKSPKLVNDLQTFFIKYAISQIANAIAIGGQAPGTEGLAELYQGQLDNILFAWQRYTNPVRALFTGDVGYLEHFERGTGTAYTLSSVLTLRQGDWKKRAYRSFKTSIRNAAPYIINYDILLDDRVGFEVDGILYVDQVSAIKYQYDRKTPITYTVSVGDDTKDQDPFAQGIKTMQAIYTILGALLGEGSLF